MGGSEIKDFTESNGGVGRAVRANVCLLGIEVLKTGFIDQAVHGRRIGVILGGAFAFGVGA